jgi:hypothetical protein
MTGRPARTQIVELLGDAPGEGEAAAPPWTR